MQLYLSNNSPKYLVDFAHFACHWLGIDKFRGEIHIDLKKSLEEESFGLCWGDRSICEIQLASRQWGEPVSREDKLKTLAHELTHAHQYLTGHLVAGETGEFKSTWLGEVVHWTPETDDTTPWEVEANQMEAIIYDKWMSINRPRG